MKRVLLTAIALLLSGCVTTTSQVVSSTPDPIVQPTQAESVLDQALPSILSQSTSLFAVQPTEPVQFLLTELPPPEEALEATDDIVIDTKQLECMATAIYWESKSESERGQIGVGYVVMNRVKSGRFKPTPCAVIYQRGQFSWANDGRSDHPTHAGLYAKTKEVARKVMLGLVPNPIGNSLFFNNRPMASWKRPLKHRIGGHYFY